MDRDQFLDNLGASLSVEQELSFLTAIQANQSLPAEELAAGMKFLSEESTRISKLNDARSKLKLPAVHRKLQIHLESQKKRAAGSY